MYVESIRSLVELAPDARLRVDHAEDRGGRSLALVSVVGTREGGALRDRPRGRDRARRSAAHPPRVVPNAASRAREQIAGLVAARGWPALRALATPDFRFEDRRKRALASGDVELYIRNLEWVLSWQGRRVEAEPLASVGDRILLERIAWTGDVEGTAIEGQFLRLIEVDANGPCAP